MLSSLSHRLVGMMSYTGLGKGLLKTPLTLVNGVRALSTGTPHGLGDEGNQTLKKRYPLSSTSVSFLGTASKKFGATTTTQALSPIHTFFPSTGVNSLLGSVRPITYASFQKGKKKSCKTVTKRFYRLYWGAWIRPKAGRFKKFYRKNGNMRVGALQHVFCKGSQSHLLDKMVGKYWRERKYYVDDPYETYHVRDNFYITRKYPQ